MCQHPPRNSLKIFWVLMQGALQQGFGEISGVKKQITLVCLLIAHTPLGAGQALHAGRRTQPLPGPAAWATGSTHSTKGRQTPWLLPNIHLSSQLSAAVSCGILPWAAKAVKNPVSFGLPLFNLVWNWDLSQLMLAHTKCSLADMSDTAPSLNSVWKPCS